MLIKDFYKDQVIFITGGTGFIGKALIEKLLRSCPDIAKIYVLIRAKKGKTLQERLEATLKGPCFRNLWQKCPDVFNKVHAIPGDCCKLKLGISPEDLERMHDVSIIIHSAATVRFDEALREAIFMNTRCTLELLHIAMNLRNLRVFVHISTTYSNPLEKVVEEKVYEPCMNWREAINYAETLDEETLNILTKKVSYFHPNTYTFTKCLGEKIVNDYKDKVPVFIYRPSIVVSAIEEPIPGWIDNVNGPIGILVACGTGLKRSELCDPDANLAVIPIDIVVKGVIISAFKFGKDAEKDSRTQKEIDVYNCAINNTAPVTIEGLIRRGERSCKDIPFDKTIWAPGGIMTKIKTWYLLQVLIQQVPLSLFIDGLLRLNGRKPMAVKAQRILVNASKALYFFMTHSWVFKNENFFALDEYVPREERKEFGFVRLCYFDFDRYFPDLVRGLREFILTEPRYPSPATIRRVKIMRFINAVLIELVMYFFLKYLFSRIF